VVLNLELALLDKLVFEKIRQGLGGRLEGALTGSATMNPVIAQFFFDLGLPVYDCYGLTETSPAVSLNCPAYVRLGSVGKLVEGVRVRIERQENEGDPQDGEIIVYGPNVMQGYHNKPEATQAVMTPDGGFRTGDRGHLDQDGYLYVTGRIKEQFKLENGKYVFPADLEEDIKLLPFVENAMIYGEGKPHLIALIYPNPEALARLAREHHLAVPTERPGESAPLKAQVLREITAQLSGKYGRYELPREVILLEEDFTVENGMLTQTMKLKRRVVLERYGERLQALYS
jgi:long-chain acyl-CoA synthetase